MYDMDQNDPWNWTNYVMMWVGIIVVVLCVFGVIYLDYTYPMSTLCCFCNS